MVPDQIAVSIIIVTHNSLPALEDTLDNLKTVVGGMRGKELIVVDNGSDDGSLQCVRQYFSEVRIIENEDIPSDKVYIGAIVSIKDLDTDEELKYMMVSPEEASYEENKLSIFAPIGAALMGKAEGEEIEAEVPAGVLRYKILKIERP